MQNIELDKIGEILESYLKVMQHEKDIETCSLEEQGVIKKLLNSKLINDFINNTSNKAKTQEAKALLLRDNAEVIVELLQIVCCDVNFKDAFQISIKLIPQMIARSSTEGILALSDTNVSIDGFARANGILEDVDEWGFIVRLSQKMFPEHSVAVDDVQRQLEEAEQNFARGMNSAFLVGCLCTSYKNRLMWSHYADGHKGFCIEYDFSGTDKETLSKIPAPVIYSKKRPQVPWKAAIDNSTQNLEEAYKDILIGLLTKDEIWEYENEWRIFVNATENSELAMPSVSCIYLGAAIDKKNRDIILEIAREHNIPVKQMKVDRGTYELHAEEIENV
ncbi:MAG: DUF2971 domain-containing protein [Lachnospiraceae bacterium]|nr:DUF2971 domain-containing protein [Lachnospiraceae bacterium]